jgi:hypothetical protein
MYEKYVNSNTVPTVESFARSLSVVSELTALHFKLLPLHVTRIHASDTFPLPKPTFNSKSVQ